MNQILYTGKKEKQTNIKAVIIVFVIILIVFAILFVLLGTYLFNGTKQDVIGNNPTQEQNPDQEGTIGTEVEESEIEITFASITDGVQITIESNVEIESATYRWDEGEENDIEIGSETKEIVQEVEIKQGKHILYVTVTDKNGHTEAQEQTVIGDKEPEVAITTDGISNYVVKAKDDEQLSRIIIVINGETILEKELDSEEFEYSVEIPEGDSVIEATVYNVNNLKSTKKGKITGFSR